MLVARVRSHTFRGENIAVLSRRNEVNDVKFDRGLAFRYGGVFSIVLAATVVASCSSSGTKVAASSAPGTAAKSGSGNPIGNSAVSISGSTNSGIEELYIANGGSPTGGGLFAKNGLQSDKLVGVGTVAADQLALVLGGHAQFGNNSSSQLLHAATENAPFVALMNLRSGGSAAIVLSAAEAQKLHVSASDGTPDSVKAQLAALKGSHLTIGVPSETGDNYSDVVAVATAQGLKVGKGGDISITSLGGTANLLAAFKSGKVSAFCLTAPQTYQPNTVQIPLYDVPPVSTATLVELVATKTYVQQHPDIVQAVVDSYLEAAQLAKTDPATALADVRSLYKDGGVSDPALQSEIYKVAAGEFGQPAITQQMFDDAVSLASTTGKVTTTFGDYVNNTFVNNGIRSLGLSFPTGP
jgi:ABC-type nitrate/sulfonate/bicarbonate transport system substrate-binding protein